MARAVDDVEHSHSLGFDPMEDQIVVEPAHRQHPNSFHLQISRRVLDAAFRLGCDVREGRSHRIEHTLGGSRIAACDVGMEVRQIILDDRRMPLDSHASVRLAAALRTRSRS